MGNQYERNLRELQAFLDNPYVAFVPVSLVTADRYSRGRRVAASKGPPHTDERYLDRRPGNGDRCGARFFRSHFECVDGLAWLHLSAES